MADTKTPTAFVAGDDPETREANRLYQEALQKLTASIDQRKNRFFDPTFLAAAQGFLAPGAPDFFESLGRVAGNVQQAQAAGEKEERDIAGQQLDVASRRLELQRQKQREEMVRKFLAGEEPEPPKPAGALPTAPAGAPAGALSAAPAGALGGAPAGAPAGALPTTQAVAQAAPQFGYQIAPPEKVLTGRQYIALGLAEGKPLNELLAKAAEIDRHNLDVKESGVFNRRSGTFQPSQFKTVPIQIYGYPGKTFDIPEGVALELENYRRMGKQQEYEDLAKRIVGGFPAPAGAPGAPSAGLMSKEEREEKEARDKALAAAETQSEIATKAELGQAARDARDIKTTATVFRRFSDDPDFSKMTGILSNEKISSGIANLVKEGIGGKGFSIGIPAIEDVMRNAGLNAEQQAKYRVFLFYTAKMQLAAEQSMKGSTTERERQILGNATISPLDTKETVQAKADIMRRKAEFDQEVHDLFVDSKMTAKEFTRSEKYNKLREKYDLDLADLAVRAKMYPSTSTPAAGQPAKPGQTPVHPDPRLIWDQKLNGWRRKTPQEMGKQ